MIRSSSAISSIMPRILRARDFSASLVATTGFRYSVRSGLPAQQVRRHRMRVRFWIGARTSSGAATITSWELLQPRTAALDGGLASRAQHPQRVNGPLRSLATPSASSRTGRLGRGDGVERVVLASRSPRGRIGAGHIERGHAGQRQSPGDAGAVAPGGLDARAQQRAVRPEPRKHRPVSGPRGEKRCGAEHRALDAQAAAVVHVLVRIDAPADPGASSGRVRHLRLRSMPGERVQPNLDRCRTRQRTDAWGQAPIRLRTRSRLAPQRVAPGMAVESGE